MSIKWLIFISIQALIQCEELEIISKSRTTFLEKYTSYRDAIIAHFQIPEDCVFASFKFTVIEINTWLFDCSPTNISLYMKYSSLPVMNPEGAKFSKYFKNITRFKVYNLNFLSSDDVQYLNFTSPEPGFYYVATFLSYSDPRFNAIQQQGLSPECYRYIDTTVHVKKASDIPIAIENKDFNINIRHNASLYYKFYTTKSIDHGLVVIKDKFLSENSDLIVRIESRIIPYNGSIPQTINSNDDSSSYVSFDAEELTWHYIEFSCICNNSDNNDSFNFTFSLKYLSSKLVLPPENNLTLFVSQGNYNNYLITAAQYRQYELVKKSLTESFTFSFDFESELESSIPVALNLSSSDFSLLKFKILDKTDIGGTLQIVAAFKPKVTKTDRGLQIENEPANHTVIGCVRSGVRELPTWPNNCEYNNLINNAPLILNRSVDNTSVFIPYPESGLWFASFKLFCGPCEPCNCPDSCQEKYRQCTENCEAVCNEKDCSYCRKDCGKIILHKESCKECDCDGPCKKNGVVCNSSIVFDISSYPCDSANCGENGRCMFMVSEAIIYSTCVCSNNYRGWDCSDDSQANPYWLVVLELLLLVLSNLMFLPTVYIAYKRNYYVEAIVYASICFFSTFYHACDAGENIISFCLTRLSTLQFGDFFCALLSIWVTLLAIADLPSYWPSIFQLTGAIILAFCTTINKTSLWVFALPSLSGLVIIVVSWYLKYYRVKRIFVNRRYIRVYLPIGLVLVTVGLIIYALLQTKYNYKYLHSMWHMIMAVSVVFLLPRKNTFQPETIL